MKSPKTAQDQIEFNQWFDNVLEKAYMEENIQINNNAPEIMVTIGSIVSLLILIVAYLAIFG